MGVTLHFDPLWSLIALALFLGLGAAFLINRSYERPAFFHPAAGDQKKAFSKQFKGLKERFNQLPAFLFFLSAIFLITALSNPTIRTEKKIGENNEAPPPQTPIEGIALYLLLDKSGSMQEAAIYYGENGQRENTTRIKMLQKLTKEFILGDPKQNLPGRPNDLIGLIEFARVPEIIAPLTLDHETLIKAIDELKVVPDKDFDGTAIGYAIYKAAYLINATKQFAKQHLEIANASYEIKDGVILLVTDGLQDPNPLDYNSSTRTIDIPTAAKYAKESGIRLYIVNVNATLAQDKFKAERGQMKESAELTGGKFFLVGDTASNSLSEIYASIDRLEKSRLTGQIAYEKSQEAKDENLLYEKRPLYPLLIGLSLLTLLSSLLFASTFFRSSP